MKESTRRPNKNKSILNLREKADSVLIVESNEKKSAREQYTARMLRKENRKDALQWLCDSFPVVFNMGAPKPLAIGIYAVIVKHEIRKSSVQSNLILREALRIYASNKKYLECLVAHDRRYDIDGDPCGVVTADQKITAQEKLKNTPTKVKF